MANYWLADRAKGRGFAPGRAESAIPPATAVVPELTAANQQATSRHYGVMVSDMQRGPTGATEIHYAARSGAKTLTLCGVTEVPKPAAVNWLYVTCRACLRLGAPENLAARGRLAALERGQPS